MPSQSSEFAHPDKRWVSLLVLLVIVVLIAAATLFSHGRHQAVIMGILQALLLSFSFALAVKMGLGMWSCGAEGPEAPFRELLTFEERRQHRLARRCLDLCAPARLRNFALEPTVRRCWRRGGSQGLDRRDTDICPRDHF